MKYVWDFDDGNNGTGQIVSHNYTDVGTFNVNLTVTDDLPVPESWSIVIPVKVISCRDVAVISVNPWANRTGWILPINMTVRNEGGAFETFNVTLYFNITGSYPIKTETITNLAPYSEKTLTIIWNVTCVALGNYTITAVACTVPYEKPEDIPDNNCTNGIVAVIWLGDLDVDGDVDEDDLWHFCAYFITYYKSGYRPEMMPFDFDRDFDVDEDDLWAFCAAFINYYKST